LDITSKGPITSTSDTLSATDHFGFVAKQIGKFKATQFTGTLTAGTDVVFDFALPVKDVNVREV
jgi:hypothetical protein